MLQKKCEAVKRIGAIVLSGLLCTSMLSGCRSNQAEEEYTSISEAFENAGSEEKPIAVGDSSRIDSVEYKIKEKTMNPSDRVPFTAYYVKVKGDLPQKEKINDLLEEKLDEIWIWATGKYDLDTNLEIRHNKDGVFCVKAGYLGYNEPGAWQSDMLKSIIIDLNTGEELTLAGCLGITDSDITGYLRSNGYNLYSDPEGTSSVSDEEFNREYQTMEGRWEGAPVSNESFEVYYYWGPHGVQGAEIPYAAVGSNGFVKK